MISGIEDQSELLRNLFENSPLLYVLWDPGVKKFFLNPYAEKVVGWTTQEANSIDFMADYLPGGFLPRCCNTIHAIARTRLQGMDPQIKKW